MFTLADNRFKITINDQRHTFKLKKKQKKVLLIRLIFDDALHCSATIEE